MSTQTYALCAEPRSITGKKLGALRRESRIPAIVYGPGFENILLSLSLRDFEKLYRQAGESSLIDLAIDGKEPFKVLIHDVQREPVTNHAVHTDLYRVNMSEKLTTSIPLAFAGESRAVKELNGILVKNITEIEIRCLPEHLLHEIPVALAQLTELEQTIKVKDLALPPGLEIVRHLGNDIIAIVMPPVSDEEMKKMEAEGAVAAPVVAEKAEEKGKGDKEREETK